MPNFTAGTSFTDGVTNDVTAAKLNALVADAVPTSSLALASTSGTISNFTSSTANITLGTIPTLTAGTTTGTAGVFTSGTITTGVIPTLTAGTTTSTNAVVTNGTITNLSATTSTFLGTITGSTNVVNIGSGQIYKDASGNVGVGTTSPGSKLTVGSGGAIQFDRPDGTNQFRLGYTANDTALKLNFNAGSTLAVVDNSGNVGIGTTSPANKISVESSGANSSEIDISLVSGTGNKECIINFGKNLATTDRFLGRIFYQVDNNVMGFNTNNTERLRIDSSGGVTIAGLAGSGSRAVNASAAGLLSAASDASLKEEVVGAHIAGLNEILQIHPKMYRWKDDIANRGENASVELGFIANDVAPIIPSAAPLGNDGLYGFYDRSITAALVKAVQELKLENDSLKARITALEAK